MKRHRAIPSRGTREELLNGLAAGDSALDGVVRAAMAPPDPGELNGLPAAVAVFRSAEVPASQQQQPAQKDRTMLKAIVAGATLTKLIAGAATAAAVGGVTVLAAHSTTPPPVTPGNSSVAAVQTTTDHPAMNMVPLSRTTGPGVQPTDQARLAADATAQDDTESATSTTPTTREPNASQIAGLCNAWQAHAMHANDRGKWTDSTAFRILASLATGDFASTDDEAADGTEQDVTAEQDVVDAYCDELIGPRTSMTVAGPMGTTEHPSRPDMPTQATEHPSRPDMPTQATEHPSRPDMPTQATQRPSRPDMPTQATEHPDRPDMPTQATQHRVP
jgi:hypothetical protein